MTTLEELYYGKLNPENTSYHNEKYRASRDNFEKLIELLRSDVSPDLREYLDHLCHARRQMELQHGKEMFRIGFSLAMKISAEAYSTGQQTTLSCPFENKKD